MTQQLQLGAFNIQCLGKEKMKKPKIVDAIVQIMKNYDIILIQEIRDKSGVVAQELLDALNKVAHPIQFNYAQSQPLGKYKPTAERYAYFYRVSTVKSTSTDQWPIDYKVFARPPFSISLQAPDNNYILFVGIHVAPNDAVKEINALADVYDKYEGQFKIPIIIGGDFNAAPTYVKPTDWPNIRLRSEVRFRWLILDTWDTTVTGQKKAYDRFVTTSQKFGQAGVGPLNNKDVSDHRPIFCQYV